jgi:predicted RecB family endonuclease
MANVIIDIAAEFTGKKGFKQAETATDKMTKNVKKLAGALGLAFSGQAILAYSKKAVKAFADSQLEAVQLTNAVKNLGLAFASRDIDIYIDKVERATGINRDQLQPAMIKLLQVTGSVAKSQELLNLAMDIAAGTGQDLTSTSEKLSQAYVGNFKGLRSLNLGLTQAELASSNFEDVQKRLQVLFAGQATSAANSYVGSMNKLAIASEQASEKIGKSLLDALTAISGGETVDDTVKKIDTLSSAIAGLIDVTVGLKAGEYLKRYYALKNGEIAGGFGNRSMSVLGQDTQRADQAARKAAEAAAKKRAAELLAIQKKTLKSSQDQLKIAKAKAIFDLQKIQLEAALKGKISEEERIRLLLLKAIQEENIEDIEKYTKMLNEIQGKVENLKTTLEETYKMDVGNPFISWEEGLDGVQRAIIKINEQSIELTNTIAQNSLAMGLLGGASFAAALSGARYAAQAATIMGITGTISGLPTITPPTTTTTPTTTVNVIVEGTVTSSEDLAKAIQDAVNNAGLSGNQVIFGTPDRQVAL